MLQNLETESRLSADKQFGPFISSEGLDSITAFKFRHFLKKLFNNTPYLLWTPESCCGAVEIAKSAREIAPHYLPKLTRVVVRMGTSHFWTVLQIPNQPEFIVDPAGLEEETTRLILPFFGVVTNRFPGQYARKVYATGEELTPSQERNLLRFLPCLHSTNF